MNLVLGQRRILFNTQVDDVHLATDIYLPANTKFRIRTSDLEAHVTWQESINSRLPAGSSYRIELAHNGNGNIEAGVAADKSGVCNPASSINMLAYPPATTLEFQKPLGSGIDEWPNTPTSYSWTLACTQLDPVGAWFQVAANRDKFSHLSHTFTHEALNNATTSDVTKEIAFNQAWLNQVGISAGKFSPGGLVPPAITGLHNGDAIAVWIAYGITAAVGDNTRSSLLNSVGSLTATRYAGSRREHNPLTEAPYIAKRALAYDIYRCREWLLWPHNYPSVVYVLPLVCYLADLSKCLSSQYPQNADCSSFHSDSNIL